MATNWLLSKDVQLNISYCCFNVDSITGNRQKIDKLWEKVYGDFKENWELGYGELMPEARTRNALFFRFAKLKPNLKLWGSALSFAQRNASSSSKLHDEMRCAQSFYVAKKKKEFKDFACWEVMKNHPYFIHVEASTPPPYLSSTPPYSSSHPASSMPHTIDLDEDDAFVTPMSNQGPSSPERPMGVKATKEAKKKGKKAVTPTNERVEALNRIVANQESYGRNQKDSDAIEVSLMREQIAFQNKDIQLRALAEETRIMSMDTESMTPKSKRYFTKRKAEIRSQLDEVEEEAREESYSNCYHPIFPST